MLKQYLKMHWIIITVLLFPLISFAQMSEVACSKSGYTVATINGIFTKEGEDNDKDGAKANRKAVKKLLPSSYNSEPLIVDYLYNPTHGIFGVIDLTDVAIQKTFEGVDMQDPDFLKMLNDASIQVKTQKLLLVAHSQGNFYANNFYEAVTKSGDVSEKSIGVYSVATPANYVAGNGTYRTSDTDTVINRARKVLPGTFLHAHDSINFKESDDSGKGHGFREIYLNYRGEEIKGEIEVSLSKLSTDPARSEGTLCINPPKALSTIEKVTNAVVYPVDATISVGAVALTARNNAITDEAIRKLPSTMFAVLNTYNTTVATAVWSYNTTVAVAVWSYNTTTAVAKFVGNATVAVASTVYDAVAGALSGTAVAGNNSAAVILATQSVQNLPSVSVDNNKTLIIPPTPVANDQPAPIVPPQLQPQEVFVFEPKVQGDTSVPKLVFVGLFGGGGGAPTLQVLGTQSTASVVEEVVVAGGGGAGDVLTAPALSAPQCAQTLATDGCLLATTTVRFEWAPVSGASYYATIKNGVYSTTTETALDISVRDFSDYTLEVVAVGADGNASATGTQAVSVATIPIAINEIAWMGTVASANDEWFEIKNNTTHTIDLAQWELDAKDGAPHVKFAGTIAPRAYLIFERTDDTVVSDVALSATTTGALNNGGDQLTLMRDSVIFDQTPDGAWSAGYNSTTTRKTMERYSSRESGTDPANWGTNLGYIKNGTDADGNAINGTPGAQNSVSTLVNNGQDISSDFTLTADEERYVVTRTILVATSSTLTVEPGVEIKFFSGGIHVEGQLVVSGTPGNPVLISALSSNSVGTISVGGGWVDGVYVGTDASATIDNANIENIDSIVAYDNARIEISNTDFSGSSDGIFALDRAQISVASSTIRDTYDNHAVAAYENSQVTIASSTIINTLESAAVGVYENAVMTIASTTIDGVPDGSGIVVYDGTLSIASSTIKNVEDSGILLSNSTSTISNTVIENAGWTGIDVYKGTATITDTIVSGVDGWAGISVDSPSEPVVIIGGEVFGNELFGISMYPAGAVVVSETSSVHDNGENVVVW